MALKALLTKDEFEKLHDSIKEHYKQEGDNYILDTDDSGYKNKLKEFRDNNIKLLKEQKDLIDQIKLFDGIDPDKVKEAEKKLLELQDQQLLDEGKMEELLEVRTERMKKDFDNKYVALEEANTKLEERASTSESQLHIKMVDAKIAAAINDVGTVRKGAMPDILARAGKIWKLNGELDLVAMKEDQVIIGTDGKSNLTPKEYATQLLQDAPFFFEGSSGGNSGGNDNSNSGGNDKTIAAGDKLAFGKNLEDIASGKLKVV